jgi:hypothetical protein
MKTLLPSASSSTSRRQGEGTIVHLRLLSGLVDDHQQLVERAS